MEKHLICHIFLYLHHRFLHKLECSICNAVLHKQVIKFIVQFGDNNFIKQ